MRFKNKVVIVTGSSSGIGASTALLFAEQGADLVLTYKNNKKGGEDVVNKIKKMGRNCLLLKVDLTKENDAKKLVKTVIQKYNRVDILVNNAGRYIEGDEWNGNSKVWIKSLEQNLVSMMNVSKYVCEIFIKQKTGVIVNVASRFSFSGQFDALAYSAAKAGVVNITQSYAKLLAPFGRANAVSPGAVNTGYWLTAPKNELKETLSSIPLKKLLETEDVAKAILFLASDDARMITGNNLVVDGGYNLK